MPIDSITVHLTDGIKQGDYAPNKVYDLTAFLSNPTENEVLDAVDMIVRSGERFLGRTARARVEVSAPLPPTSSASPASTGEPAAGEPQRRTRRTKAQMEADEARDRAEIEAAAAPAVSEQSTSATDTASAQSSPTADEDEWAAAAPAELTITDQELNHACSVSAERVKDPQKVKGVIAKFNPGGDAWDPAKPGGRRFTVNDLPANQRPDFLAQLKALT